MRFLNTCNFFIISLNVYTVYLIVFRVNCRYESSIRDEYFLSSWSPLKTLKMKTEIKLTIKGFPKVTMQLKN